MAEASFGIDSAQGAATTISGFFTIGVDQAAGVELAFAPVYRGEVNVRSHACRLFSVSGTV